MVIEYNKPDAYGDVIAPGAIKGLPQDVFITHDFNTNIGSILGKGTLHEQDGNLICDAKITTVFEFEKPSRNAEHPTMKPIPLFAYQIGNSSKQGDIVADGFGGSGTTMVACHQMNRKAYLVEFDSKYCQVIVDRMLKLDPSIEIKKNGQPYKNGHT